MKRAQVRQELVEIFGPRGVLWEDHHLLLYEYDASIDKGRPDFVVFPTSTEQVVAAVRIANRYGLPIVVRGAGTGLSGGAVADQGGLMIVTTRMRRILEIDPVNLRAVVQPGVVNIAVSQAAAAHGLYYAPDPSSQKACTIGGNIAENSGGPHCLAYGVTTNHVLGLEVVLPDGEVVEVGGAAFDWPGYDLTGLIVGSEGTLGIVTQAILRLMPAPEAVVTLLAVFDTVDQASEAVSAIIADGTIPGAIEMMDHTAIQAVESAKRCGYPMDAGAVLLIDVEGLPEGLEELAHHIARICEHFDAREVRIATDPAERERLWSGRKGAFGAMGRLAPSYYVQDGVVPRDQLPRVLRQIQEIGQRYGLTIANVFHAGDGNLHPLILFDERDPELTRRAVEAGAEIIRACVEAGGRTIGVTVDRFDRWGLKANPYLDVEIKFPTLFQRLHYLVTTGDALIALPGGIGTLSEMALAWSLLQTGELPPRPFLLLGSRWRRLLEAYLDPFYIREEDAAILQLVETPEEAIATLEARLERPVERISRPWG